MPSAPFRIDRRASRQRLRVASERRPEWLEIVDAAVLYFGVTLGPVLVVILLHLSGLIA